MLRGNKELMLIIDQTVAGAISSQSLVNAFLLQSAKSPYEPKIEGFTAA